MSTEKKLQIRNSTAEFLIFTGQSGEQSIEARYEDESVWLTQKLMAALFAVDVRTISEHLGNLFASAELQEEAVIRKFRTTAADGKNYNTQFYNLDAIISVGYRVNSVRATQFRQWATQVLREFAIKGYVLDKKRMENGTFPVAKWSCWFGRSINRQSIYDYFWTVGMSIFLAQKILRKFSMLFKHKIMQRKFAYFSLIGIITPNTPPMPLLSTHTLGGFFISGGGYAV